MPKGRPRSSSAPRERGPRAVHKNSPSPPPQQQQQQFQRSQAPPPQRPQPTARLNLDALRPGSAQYNGNTSYRSNDGYGTNRSMVNSPLQSNRSNCSVEDFNISQNHVGFNTNRGGYTSDMEKCICHICTCGKHRCPVRHTPNTAKLDATTSYANTFKEHSPDFYPARVAPNPNLYLQTKTTPGHFDTTHKAAFIAPEPEHHKVIHQQKMERAAPRRKTTDNEKFDHTTTLRADYPWHDVAPPLRARPVNDTAPGGGKFYGTTTAMEHFQAWDPTASRSPSVNRNSSMSPFPDEGPMDFNTSYKNNFVEHGVERSRPFKPNNSYSYGSPRDFNTSHKADFAGKQNPLCPAVELPPRPASARTGHVRYQMDLSGSWR